MGNLFFAACLLILSHQKNNNKCHHELIVKSVYCRDYGQMDEFVWLAWDTALFFSSFTLNYFYFIILLEYCNLYFIKLISIYNSIYNSMCQYFSISNASVAQHYLSDSGSQDQSRPRRLSDININNCVLVGHYFIYTHGQNIIIMKIGNQGNSNQNKTFQITIPITTLDMSVIDHTLSYNFENQNDKVDKISLLLINYSQVCALTIYIDKSTEQCTISHKVHKSYNFYGNNLVMLLNKHAIICKCCDVHNNKQYQMLVIAGLQHNPTTTVTGNARKLSVNLFHIGSSTIKMGHRLYIQIDNSVKSPHEQFFSLCQPYIHSLQLLVYPMVVEKSVALLPRTYDLTPYLQPFGNSRTNQENEKEGPQQYWVKPEEKVTSMLGLAGHYNIRAAFRQSDDFYVIYTQYVPYSNKQNNEKQVESSNNMTQIIQSHIWVYSAASQYTRNIVQIKGAIINIKVTPPSTSSCKSMILLVRNQKMDEKACQIKYNYKVCILKMDSAKYHPMFQICMDGSNAQMPVAIADSLYTGSSSQSNLGKYFVTVSAIQSVLYKNTEIGGSKRLISSQKAIKIYEKIGKKYIYCQFWEGTGSIGGTNFLNQILAMFQ